MSSQAESKLLATQADHAKNQAARAHTLNAERVQLLVSASKDLWNAEEQRKIEELKEWAELDRLEQAVSTDKTVTAERVAESERRQNENRAKHELGRMVKLSQLEKLADSLMTEQKGGVRAEQAHEFAAEKAELQRMSKLVELYKRSEAEHDTWRKALKDAQKKELSELQRLEKLAELEKQCEKWHLEHEQPLLHEAHRELVELLRMEKLVKLQQQFKSLHGVVNYGVHQRHYLCDPKLSAADRKTATDAVRKFEQSHNESLVNHARKLHFTTKQYEVFATEEKAADAAWAEEQLRVLGEQAEERLKAQRESDEERAKALKLVDKLEDIERSRRFLEGVDAMNKGAVTDIPIRVGHVQTSKS